MRSLPGTDELYQVSQTTFSVAYGTGSVSGVVGTDTLHFSGITVPLTFGLGQNVSDDFSSYPMDGILALGRPETISSDSTGVNAPSLIDVLVSQKVISAKFFGLDIWRNADGGSNNGEINFGSPDSSRYDGGLNYIGAISDSNGFWEIPASDAGVDGKSAGLTGRSAIIDSGTSFILMPQGDAAKLHALIPGSSENGETFTVPCDTTKNVQLSFGGTAYDISTKDYVGKAVGGGACSSNIVGRQVFGATQWLVGDVFLKNVYAGFDYDGQRVGLAAKKGATAASSTPTSSTAAQTTTSQSTNTSPLQISPTIATTSTISTTPTPSSLPPLNTGLLPTSSTYISVSTASSPTSTIIITTTTNNPQITSSTQSSLPSLTSFPTTDSVQAATTTASNGSPLPSNFTPGFLPSGTSFATISSAPTSASTSATGSPAVHKGNAVLEKQPAALLALFVALCCAALFGV
jgi:hypothetical protein